MEFNLTSTGRRYNKAEGILGKSNLTGKQKAVRKKSKRSEQSRKINRIK